jgi:cobalt-zinc-cadmium efflux system protein
LRESLHLALNAVPNHVNRTAVEQYLQELPGITEIHDLHIWGMSTTESALTVHLVVPSGYPGDIFVDSITQTLKERFSVNHATIQVELGTTVHTCSLQPA